MTGKYQVPQSDTPRGSGERVVRDTLGYGHRVVISLQVERSVQRQQTESSTNHPEQQVQHLEGYEYNYSSVTQLSITI